MITFEYDEIEIKAPEKENPGKIIFCHKGFPVYVQEISGWIEEGDSLIIRSLDGVLKGDRGVR